MQLLNISLLMVQSKCNGYKQVINELTPHIKVQNTKLKQGDQRIKLLESGQANLIADIHALREKNL